MTVWAQHSVYKHGISTVEALDFTQIAQTVLTIVNK